MDKRWEKLGEILVNYSTRVVPGERVMIAMIEPETYPLAKGVYRAAIKAGAFPQVQFLSETLRRCVLKHGNREQIEWIPEMEIWGMQWADVQSSQQRLRPAGANRRGNHHGHVL